VHDSASQARLLSSGLQQRADGREAVQRASPPRCLGAVVEHAGRAEQPHRPLERVLVDDVRIAAATQALGELRGCDRTVPDQVRQLQLDGG